MMKYLKSKWEKNVQGDKVSWDKVSWDKVPMGKVLRDELTCNFQKDSEL